MTHKTHPLTLERKDAPGQQRQVRAYPLHIKAAGDDGSIEGYGSVFGVRDAYDDVIAAGAFAQSLADHKASSTLPAMLWQHDSAQPIGVWTEMGEDDRGLRIKGQLALETVRGKEAHALLKLGALNGLSIGFMSKQWAYDRDTEVRTLTEIDLWEVSLVTFPANRASRITAVKSADVDGLTTIRQLERALRDVGFSESEAKAFVAKAKRIATEERDAQDVAAALQAASRLFQSIRST